jgi:hypothetical protein
MSTDASLIMTRSAAGIMTEVNLDRMTLLNLELKRQERRRNLRYSTKALAQQLI